MTAKVNRPELELGRTVRPQLSALIKLAHALATSVVRLATGRVTTPANASYRPDIDGLRAIAVLAVMVYHLGFRPTAGGFVGVDVFFVISGYLIGALVFADIEAKRFSFARFYVRRMRRLFPALFVMLAVTGLASAVVLYPNTFVNFGSSLAAAVTSTSNIYFWLTSDYFDTSSITNPLLHTWSLSVEEQFYLLFPALALAIARYAPGRAALIIFLIGVASFACSAVSSVVAPEAAFYLLPNRAWELALGIYLAATPAQAIKPMLRALVAAAGLALIVASVFLFSGETLGLAPIPACVGTAMIIAAGRSGDNWVSDALSWRPLVFVGLISYSLYLWHWPIIVLYQYRLGETFLDLTEKFELIPIIFAAAVLSWFFVERPFRRGPSPAPIAFSVAGGAAAFLAAAAVAIVAMRGFPTRFEPEVVRLASYLNYDAGQHEDAGLCMLNGARETLADYDGKRCLHRASNQPNVLLVGDSHALNLHEGLDVTLPQLHLMQATATKCRPVLRRRLREAANCRRLMDFVYHDYLPHNRVDLLILAGRWTRRDLDDLAETLEWLEQLRVPVVVVGPFPRYQGAVPQLVALARQGHDPGLPQRRLSPDVHVVEHELRGLARRYHARYASPYEIMCPQHECIQLTEAGVPLQHDYGHLTREGSIFVVDGLNHRGAFEIEATEHQHVQHNDAAGVTEVRVH